MTPQQTEWFERTLADQVQAAPSCLSHDETCIAADRLASLPACRACSIDGTEGQLIRVQHGWCCCCMYPRNSQQQTKRAEDCTGLNTAKVTCRRAAAAGTSHHGQRDKADGTHQYAHTVCTSPAATHVAEATSLPRGGCSHHQHNHHSGSCCHQLQQAHCCCCC